MKSTASTLRSRRLGAPALLVSALVQVGSFSGCGSSILTVGPDASPDLDAGLGPGPGPEGGDIDGGGLSEVPVNHRASSPVCPAQRGSDVPVCDGDSGAPATCFAGECSEDSDCTAGDNGRCLVSGPAPVATCSYDQCSTDADCAAGMPCQCRTSATDPAPNVCLMAGDCVIDADCGPGGYCSPSNFGQWCQPVYFCHTPSDTCVNDSDCPGNSAGCNFDKSKGAWSCGGGCGPAPP